jgi:hypothetical protein
MKHILNDLTEQEKNSIREQHTGGMKVMTENFNKLANSKLGDSKPLVESRGDYNHSEIINEQLVDECKANTTGTLTWNTKKMQWSLKTSNGFCMIPKWNSAIPYPS